MSASLQDRVQVFDNALHHAGERGAGPALIIWHSVRDRGNAKSVMGYLNSTDEKVASYHYLIDRDGAISRMCRPEWVAYHAGDSAWPNPVRGDGTESCKPNKGKSVNAISLGFAFCTDDDGANNKPEDGAGDDEHITAEQIESGLWLGKVYMARYDIPPALNLGHKEVSPGRKTDPIGLDMDDWRRQLEAQFGMSNPITALITGGFSGVLGSVNDIIGKFVADPKDKINAQLEVTRIANEYQIQVLQADKELAVQQASVVTAEVKSDSWLARNWRPITMLTFVFIIVWNYIVVGTIGAFAPSIHPIEIPPDMWSLLKLGIGGYIGARTVEKVADTAPQIAAALKK